MKNMAKQEKEKSKRKNYKKSTWNKGSCDECGFKSHKMKRLGNWTYCYKHWKEKYKFDGYCLVRDGKYGDK